MWMALVVDLEAVKDWFERLIRILDFELIKLGNIAVTPGVLIKVALYLLVTVLLLRLLKRVLVDRSNWKLPKGRRWAFFKIVKYIVWVIAAFVVFQSLGIEMSPVFNALAGLLIGLGVGAAPIFNAYLAGIIIQFEGTIQIDDVVEVDGIVGVVKDINLRNSKVQTRDDIVMIMPNHKFIQEKAINWSHDHDNTRFQVKVGVSYGSDVDNVEKVLLECMSEQKGISNYPKPMVWFDDFGNSSLDFNCVFWSNESFTIPKLKSELRFKIWRKFQEFGISIPFPQSDLHIKTVSEQAEGAFRHARS